METSGVIFFLCVPLQIVLPVVIKPGFSLPLNQDCKPASFSPSFAILCSEDTKKATVQIKLKTSSCAIGICISK